ncbi:MAG: peptidylprolyl isomerase [Planctomycetes bacterium]|nr:peptidylprolyl isomerase [Planctomycetota bacterium]
MKRNPSLAPFLTLALVVLPAAAQDSKPAPDVVGPQVLDPRVEMAKIKLVEVDGHPLTLADAMEAFTSSHTGHGALVRGEAALRELMGRLIERELFLAEADALGLPEDPVVTGTVENYLRSEVVTAFWKRELNDKIVVTEDEIQSFYAKTDVALKLTLIEVRDRDRCEALRARVLAGEDMSALATKESAHPSRSFGGLLPYVRRGEIDLGIEKEAFALETPQSLTPVVTTESGFAFARLEERSVNPTRLPPEVALPQIRKILRDRVEDKLRAEVEARLEATGSVTIEEPLLLPEMVLEKAEPDAVVARSLGRTLTVKELREALDVDQLRHQDPETVQGAARFVARDWAMREVIWSESETNGLRDDAEIVFRAERQRRETILGLLAERYVYAEVAITEDDLRKYYEENKTTSFTRPPERRLAYIVVATKDEAEKLLARYKTGETFEALAKQASIDKTSAVHGGRIGWIKKGDILPEVEVRAFSIAKGAVDGPIETSAGWFLVYVLEVKDAELIPFNGARTAVQKRLMKERQKEAWSKWSTRLRERAMVKIDDDGLRAAVEWLARQPAPEKKLIDPNVPHGEAKPSATPGATPVPEKKG